MPLAIELAAARVRALSLDEIVGSLHDRFRLLTGGARTAVRSIRPCARPWTGHTPCSPNPSGPVPALGRIHGRLRPRRRPSRRRDHGGGALPGPRPTQPAGRQVTRRRREHLWPNALSAAGNRPSVCTGEAWRIGRGRRGARETPRHFWSMAARLDAPATSGHQQRISQALQEMDNLRAAFTWSRENDETSKESEFATFLQSVWLVQGRIAKAWRGSTPLSPTMRRRPRPWLRPKSERSPTRHSSTPGMAHSTSRTWGKSKPRWRSPGKAETQALLIARWWRGAASFSTNSTPSRISSRRLGWRATWEIGGG